MYKIMVRTVNNNLLTFTVDKYNVGMDGMLTFTDQKTSKVKRFHPSNCEIEEEKGDDKDGCR